MSRVLIFLMVMLLVSCHEEALEVDHQSLVGHWLCGPIEMDPNVYRPIAQFMHMKSDSTMKYLSEYSEDTILHFEVTADSLVLPFISMPKSNFRMKGNKMWMRKFHPIHYLKIDPKPIELDTLEIRQRLVGKSWKSKVDIVTFHEDSIVVYDLESQKKETLCWEVFDYDGIKFLNRKGNFVDCSSVRRYLEYLAQLKEASFDVVRWDKDDFYKIKYERYLDDLPKFKEDEFKLCNPFIYRNSPSDRYYYKYTTFEGGIYNLKKHFDEHYKEVKRGSNSGIIRIGFVVNCIGELGKFDILELDYDYRPININKNISSQLVSILKGAGNWNPGERKEQKIDTYKYLSFKIDNGKIIEIFP